MEDKHNVARTNKRESGEPGGGAGRRDEDVGGSGVYPFGTAHPDDVEPRWAGEWAQQLGGDVGGASELNPYELGLTDNDLERVSRDNTDTPL